MERYDEMVNDDADNVDNVTLVAFVSVRAALLYPLLVSVRMGDFGVEADACPVADEPELVLADCVY
ncbi:hypothetical protein BLOT_011842 [Blomia tropicalis]|nr:hypothetical protein BLOT_011842 [Blomia tropicalis]